MSDSKAIKGGAMDSGRAALGEVTAQGVDKIARYGWTVADSPGKLVMLHKDVLQIHPAYQRDANTSKVISIASQWSWISLGALVVGERSGEFWVIDGQHRALAAKRRSDITTLPCVVFATKDTRQEAQGFLDLNTGRKPVSIFAKQKAMLAAGDETAAYVSDVCAALGVEIKQSAHVAGQIKAVGWMMRRAGENREKFCAVLELASEMSEKDGVPIHEKLLEGLWYINDNCAGGLADKRLAKRLKDKGALALNAAAIRAAAYFSRGGARVFAEGMLAEVNTGLQQKFSIADSAQS